MNELFKKGTRVYCLGIGGIGLSAAAQWLNELGIEVSGSDNSESVVMEMLRKQGIDANADPGCMRVPDGIAALIYSDAVPFAHPVRANARLAGVRELNYAETLGILTKNYRCVAVAGSHGKSTTTALIGHILTEIGTDPTVVVGTKVPSLGDVNFRFGKSDVVVVEADEYRSHFLQLKPNVCIVTNIDHDHVDVFPTKESYADAYNKFVEKIEKGGDLILRSSDPYTADLSQRRSDLAVKTFDIESKFNNKIKSENKLVVRNSFYKEGRQYFSISIDGIDHGEFNIAFPGEHLLLDAVAAVAAIMRFTKNLEKVRSAMASFKGTWRRFERVGTFKGAEVISDYAHHPTEVRALLLGARQSFPNKKIKIIFQPHQGSRAQAFGADFVDALTLADEIILVEVFSVAGREDATSRVTDRHWVDALVKLDKKACFAETLERADEFIHGNTNQDDVLLFVGAGSIDQLARKIVL